MTETEKKTTTTKTEDRVKRKMDTRPMPVSVALIREDDYDLMLLAMKAMRKIDHDPPLGCKPVTLWPSAAVPRKWEDTAAPSTCKKMFMRVMEKHTISIVSADLPDTWNLLLDKPYQVNPSGLERQLEFLPRWRGMDKISHYPALVYRTGNEKSDILTLCMRESRNRTAVSMDIRAVKTDPPPHPHVAPFKMTGASVRFQVDAHDLHTKLVHLDSCYRDVLLCHDTAPTNPHDGTGYLYMAGYNKREDGKIQDDSAPPDEPYRYAVGCALKTRMWQMPEAAPPAADAQPYVRAHFAIDFVEPFVDATADANIQNDDIGGTDRTLIETTLRDAAPLTMRVRGAPGQQPGQVGYGKKTQSNFWVRLDTAPRVPDTDNQAAIAAWKVIEGMRPVD